MHGDACIEPLAAEAIEAHLGELADLLTACVHDGASVGFILPYGLHDSRSFWLDRVRPALIDGTRIVLAAKIAGRIVGSVQLDCGTPANQAHRVEVSKLLVHPEARRRGIAKALMIALEARADRIGRSLITLDTASDGAAALYRSLGYETAGAIPAFARDPIEDRCDPTIFMYKRL